MPTMRTVQWESMGVTLRSDRVLRFTQREMATLRRANDILSRAVELAALEIGDADLYDVDEQLDSAAAFLNEFLSARWERSNDGSRLRKVTSK